MKSNLLFLTFAILLTSCSSVYKSGQTPDDVYYSPERQREEYVRVEERNDRTYRNDELSREDRYLRMKARNRRYGLLDDDYDTYAYNGSSYYRYNDYYRMNRYGYYNNSYNNWLIWNNIYGNMYYNPNYYNPYYYNPYHNNPYYAGTVYGNTSPVYNKPRTTNLHVFDRSGNSNNPNVPRNNGRTFSNTQGEDNYRGSGTNAGGFLRNTLGTNNSNSSNSSSEASKSSGSSNSGSSSSSGNSGSSRAPVRKF